MPADTLPHPVDQGLALARLHALAGDAVLAVWEAADADVSTRLIAWIDDAAAPRPYTTLKVPTAWGGTRMIAALRWPAAARSGGILTLRDLEGRPVVEARSQPGAAFAELDPAALLSGLKGPARIRVVRLILDFCRSSFRFHDNAGFAAACRRLALEIAPQPAPLETRVTVTRDLVLCDGAVPIGFGDINSVILIGGGWVREGGFRPAVAPASAAQGGHVPFRLIVDKRHVDAEATVILIGQDSLACRQIKPTAAGQNPLLEWLERSPDVPAASRAYVMQCLAARAAEDTQAAAALREMQLFLPLPQRHLLSPSKPVGAGVELSIGHATGGLFVAGWLRDPHRMIDAIRVQSPIGGACPLDAPLHRFPRADIEKQYRQGGAAAAADPMIGFATFLDGMAEDVPVYQHRFEVLLASGARIELVPPLQPVGLAEARNAVLGSIPPAFLTLPALADCIAPAAGRLHAAHMATRTAPDIIAFGEGPARPRVSVIIPLYKVLDFLRFQMAAFAIDPAFREVELIFVLDSPEQRTELEHLLRGLHRLYDLPLRLAVMPANYGYAAANNSGAALARGRHLLLLNSDVIPEAPGWLDRLTAALEAGGETAAVGPKLLFEDDSLQHAGLFFGRDLKGQWLNQHYFKGLPRDFAPANVARSVPGVTGAAMLIRRAVYERLGGFTEDYIIGDYEDSDLCLKIRNAGHDIHYVPAAELYHLERKSIERHAGYMRGVVSQYNQWLHAGRWDGLMQEIMSGAIGAAAGTSAAAALVTAPAARAEAAE